jgi:hypothetical protein
MRVGIDDARRDEEAVGVDRVRRGGAREPTDLDDPAVLDRDVGTIAGETGPIYDRAVLDDQVVRHRVPPAVLVTARARIMPESAGFDRAVRRR